MRDLDASAVNKIVINDARSGTEIELYYRNPTTQEEVEYQTKLYKRKSNKLIMNPKIKGKMICLVGSNSKSFFERVPMQVTIIIKNVNSLL